MNKNTMSSTAMRWCAGLLLAAGSLLAAKPAPAAVFVGAFDPAFGPSIPNLGFRGSATFSIPDACLAINGVVGNADPCSNGSMSMLSATVNFYNLAAPDLTIGSQSFTPPSVSLIEAQFFGGTLVGVETPLVGPRFVSVPQDGSFYTGNLWLQFKDRDPIDLPGAYLYACLTTPSCEAPQVRSNVATVRFTQVAAIPEPETWALFGLGLAAVGYAGRRRARPSSSVR